MGNSKSCIVVDNALLIEFLNANRPIPIFKTLVFLNCSINSRFNTMFEVEFIHTKTIISINCTNEFNRSWVNQRYFPNADFIWLFGSMRHGIDYQEAFPLEKFVFSFKTKDVPSECRSNILTNHAFKRKWQKITTLSQKYRYSKIVYGILNTI